MIFFLWLTIKHYSKSFCSVQCENERDLGRAGACRETFLQILCLISLYEEKEREREIVKREKKKYRKREKQKKKKKP